MLRRLAAAEVLLTLLEVALVVPPLMSLAGPAIAGGRLLAVIAPVAAALWVVSLVRLIDGLRPVVAVSQAKARQARVEPAAAEAARKALARVPTESGLLRWLLWSVGSVLTAGTLVHRGLLSGTSGSAVVSLTLLGAGAAAGLRSLVVDRILGSAGRRLLPNADPLLQLASRYRKRLRWTAAALLGGVAAASGALVSAAVELPGAAGPLMAALATPALALGAVFWERSLRRRTAPVETYLDGAVRSPGTRGPARDEPAAVAAYRAAQSVPYRLAFYQCLAEGLALLAVVVAARRLAGMPTAAAARVLGAVGLSILACGLSEVLLLREVLRPLLANLGGRHRLPPDEVRSPLGLGGKLAGAFGGVVVFTAGIMVLIILAPVRDGASVAGAAAVGAALALGLVLLVIREVMMPVRRLEARADELARGELARPVAPAGEADEIGRLIFAFEEMRRALRDRLRSTESINIDLEREVRRRTEALEQRNQELRDALEKLRRAQDELVRSEKLASMGRLVSGIAHEINNPVNAVINSLGPLEEVVRDLSGSADAEVAEAARNAGDMLAVIQRGASRTKAIVQALHNYSRGDEGNVREVHLARSVEDTLDLLRHRLKGIEVVKQVDPTLRVAGHAGQIDQVLMNLVTNAAQALGQRGGTIRVVAERRGPDAVLSVADSGPGIPADVLPRIFDPFFTTKDVGEGSGLGLSIVHGIVERHGGRIDVESELGRGTRFAVSLPAVLASTEATGGETGEAAGGATRQPA